ncbi:hypothetical protein ANO11243_019180 [Dothideomycetidae sp. 11243]|nr:hypothetical protein ANO11243_019180 [fungal sp. No.11243]
MAERDSLESQAFERLQARMLQACAPRHVSPSSPEQLPHARPRLNPHSRSAPEMGAMLNDSNHQGPDDPRSAMTFHAFEADLDGDTQPMPSQVYRGFSTVIVPASSPGKNGVNGLEDGTQYTPVAEGEVDLMPYWETQLSSVGHAAPLDVHSIDESAEDTYSQGFLSSMKRDAQPKTPAFAGLKRRRNGETVSPTTASKTPGSALSNLFGPLNSKPLLTATQLFDHTQAVSSPAADQTRSDPVDSRPSPDLMRMAAGSPSFRAMSSPNKPSALDPTELMPGPRDQYRSLDESQRRRRLLLLQQAKRIPSSSKVMFDFDDDTQADEDIRIAPPPAYESRSRQRIDSAPQRPLDPSHSSIRGTHIPPAGSLDERAVIEVSDQVSSIAEDESMDEYDEYSQDVFPSQGARRSKHLGLRSETPEIDETEMEVAGSPAVLPSNGISGVITGEPNLAEAPNSGKEVLTIANSQPSKPSQSYPPRPVEPSSLSSFVPASQIGLPSSQTRAHIAARLNEVKSSSLPKPPITSQPEIEIPEVQSNIPSSPPAMILEEDGETQIKESIKPQTPGTPVYAALFEHPRPSATSLGIDARLGSSRHSTNQQLIPETGMVSTSSRSSEKLGNGVDTTVDGLTNTTGSEKPSMFTTAATHISASQGLSGPGSQASRSAHESPEKSGKVRRFADIANEPTPPNSMGDVDVSIGMEIVGDEDKEFAELMQQDRKTGGPKLTYGRKSRHWKKQQITETEVTQVEKTNVTDDVNENITGNTRDSKRRKLQHISRGAEDKDDTSNADAVADRGDERTDSVDPSQKGPSPHDGNETATSQIHTMNQIITEPADPYTPVEEIPEEGDEITVAPLVKEATPDQPRPPAQNRVFALFNGSVNGYYPATCLSITRTGVSLRYNVRFDDGTCTSLERHHVCAMDLRRGDVVKVDRPNMRNHMYLIDGFVDADEAQMEAETAMPDIHGHRFVKVRLKRSDSSKNPRVAAATAAIDRPVTIQVGWIYVTQSMWVKFNTRSYDHPQDVSRHETPSVDVSAPATPSSRARRQALLLGQLPSAESVTSSRSAEGSVFANMAFAVSYSSNDSDAQRDRLVSLIQSQSGRVLRDGLQELFEPFGKSGNNDQLQLKPDLGGLGFVALIADSHSRTQKYIQALALSLPALHFKWIEDSVRTGHALPWSRYLLPAGESRHLFDAIRSRTIPIYDPLKSSLSTILSKRERLLPSEGVLLLSEQTTKKSKSDKRQLYAFLSLAMGAAHVKLTNSIPEAKFLLDRERDKWKWIHCPAEMMPSVASSLGGVGAGGPTLRLEGGKKGKRKRSLLSDEVDVQGRMDFSLANGVRVVCDEWVIQSLILGA